ncbi:MAG: hypothetical protein AAF449_11300 [Myxococcota bacterium]
MQSEGDNCSVESRSSESRPVEDHTEAERIARATPPPRWMTALDRLASREAPTEDRVGAVLSGDSQAATAPVWYLINERESRLRDELVVDFFRLQSRPARVALSESNKDGQTNGDASPDGTQFVLRPFEVDQRRLAEQTSNEDAAILALLLGSSAEDPSKMNIEVAPRYGRASVRSGLYDLVLPKMAASGRFGLLEGGGSPVDSEGLSHDDGLPYRFGLVVKRVAEQGWKLWGRLWRGEDEIEEVDLASPAARAERRPAGVRRPCGLCRCRRPFRLALSTAPAGTDRRARTGPGCLFCASGHDAQSPRRRAAGCFALVAGPGGAGAPHRFYG